MSVEDDKFWDEVAGDLRKKRGLLTPEEAQAAYDAAPEEPLSEDRAKEIVHYAVSGGES
jgi:hypothetical protein